MAPVEVLLVEDDAGDALLISQILAEAAMPVKLRIARDGAQALQMLNEDHARPDLLLLDLVLPGVDGLRVLESYRPADIPIVVFSASRRDSDRLLAKARGATDYIVKPTDLQQFREAVLGVIQKWVGRRGGDSADSAQAR
jgi:CheY-like chemotaxis protein